MYKLIRKLPLNRKQRSAVPVVAALLLICLVLTDGQPVFNWSGLVLLWFAGMGLYSGYREWRK